MMTQVWIHYFQFCFYADSLVCEIFHNLFSILQNLNLIIEVAVKMKNSKSHKNITVVTDRKAQHDLLMSHSSSSLQKGSATCTNRPQTSPYHRSRMPSTTKNKTQMMEQNHCGSSSMSGQKPSRQRSNSTKSKEDSLTQQTRKKQLDYLCFQRMINQFKKYIVQQEERWDLNCLCYGQLIRLLWLCRYTQYSNQQQFIKNNEQGELKKVYCLWLSISVKKIINYRDFLTFMQIMQNIYVDQQKIDLAILHLQEQMKIFNNKIYQEFQQDPNYTFFLKRMQIQRKDNRVYIDAPVKQKIISYFKSFKFTKLKDSGLFQCVKVQEEHISFSKKTNELAEQKRRKIQSKIRQNKPHVENINLLDLLSYRQRDHMQNAKKQAEPKKKKTYSNVRRGELKRQIQLLSRPKMYFDERKQDEIIFEKQQQQFTFHPKINTFKNDTKDKILKVKNVDKVLIRMKQARQLKQQKKDMMKKGWSNHNSKIPQQVKSHHKLKSSVFLNDANKQNNMNEQQIQKEVEKQKQQIDKPKTEKTTKYEVSKDYLRIPILYIDVNIEEGKKQRIIIYDNDKAEDLARQFGQKHKLSEETVGRLELLLQQQMDTVLARIDEETDDECSIIY